MSEIQTDSKSKKPKVCKNVKWALICGTLGILSTLRQIFCFGGLLILSGFILGILSLIRIKKSHGILTGRWLALLSLLPFVIYIVLMTIEITTFNRSIHSAAIRGNLVDIKSMLAKNPELINKKDRIGKTPLHCAAGEGHKEVVEFLCACGADVNAQNQFGKTALYYATKNGHKEVIETLRTHSDTNKDKEHNKVR